MPWFNPYLVSRDANYRARYDEATKIDAEYVLRKLHQIVERCLQEVKPALHATPALAREGTPGRAQPHMGKTRTYPYPH